MEGFNSRLYPTEENITELEDIAVKTLQTEAEIKRDGKKMNKSSVTNNIIQITDDLSPRKNEIT